MGNSSHFNQIKETDGNKDQVDKGVKMGYLYNANAKAANSNFISEGANGKIGWKGNNVFNQQFEIPTELGKRNFQTFQQNRFRVEDLTSLSGAEIYNHKQPNKLRVLNFTSSKYNSNPGMSMDQLSEISNKNPTLNSIQEENASRNSIMTRTNINMKLLYPVNSKKTRVIERLLKEMKVNFLRAGIKMEKAVLETDGRKKLLFNESNKSNKMTSLNLSFGSKSITVQDGGKSVISTKIFDETFYNKYLLDEQSFMNTVYNTFLFQLKEGNQTKLMENYLAIMEELKTWMFQEFEHNKTYSNAEQFMKYFNLQVPIKQHYYSGLAVKDRVKLMSFFFCKFFNRNILMTLFGNIWPEIKMHHNYKTHIKMYSPFIYPFSSLLDHFNI